MSAPLHIGDTTTVTGVVRTVTALVPAGHLRVTVDVAPSGSTPVAPLTSRGALAEVIKGHQACCLRDFTKPDHLADALLTSVTKLVADELRAAAEEYSGVYRRASAIGMREVYDFLCARADALD